jgi:hypothetical protein
MNVLVVDQDSVCNILSNIINPYSQLYVQLHIADCIVHVNYYTY